jgi:thiol-disulfide isomerase/thioredoxin
MTDTSHVYRRPLLLGAIVLAVALGGAAALYGTSGAGNRAAETRNAACPLGKAVAERIAPLARGEVAAVAVAQMPKPAPEIAFTSPEGKAMTLADLKGRTVLLNLWATWCAPCRQEMPALDKLQGELGGPDFEVVALNVDTRNLDRPKAWLEEAGVRRLAYYADPQGRVLPILQRSGEVVGLPTTLLIDPEGCEIAVLKGPADWGSQDAARLVRAALGR